MNISKIYGKTITNNKTCKMSFINHAPNWSFLHQLFEKLSPLGIMGCDRMRTIFKLLGIKLSWVPPETPEYHTLSSARFRENHPETPGYHTFLGTIQGTSWNFWVPYFQFYSIAWEPSWNSWVPYWVPPEAPGYHTFSTARGLSHYAERCQRCHHNPRTSDGRACALTLLTEELQ